MDGLVGNSTWTCLANGNWKGIAPTCRESLMILLSRDVLIEPSVY